MSSTISEEEFEKLCASIFEQRHEIHALNPNVSQREALLWMLLGSLVSLLSVPILEQPSTLSRKSEDPYGDAICELLENRMLPAFDPRGAFSDQLSAISKK